MVKRRHRMFYILMLLATTLCLQLQATTITLATQNQSLTQAAQSPFQIIVTVHNGDRNTGNATIKGLEQLKILGQQRSNNVTMNNGHYSSTVSYLYTVQAPQPGTYNIGPATISQQGQTIQSNTLTLNITPPGTQQQTANAKNTNTVQLTLTSNKNTIVIGEPVELTATLVSSRSITEAAMGTLESPDFTAKELGAPTQRTEVINGAQHIIIDKKFQLTPHKAGIFSLGPIRIDLAVMLPRQPQQHRGFFDDSFFNDFFGNRTEVMHLQSNPLTINVQPLPSDNVDIVGIFSAYRATLSSQEAAVNEPITLTLELEGVADFDHINVPRLTLPPSVKHYESKNETVLANQPSSQAGKKHFEFILQASRPGQLTIPAQQCTFYDYHLQQIRTIQTAPLHINITGQASMQAQTTRPQDATSSQPQQELETPPADPLPPHKPTTPIIPWWLFITILIMPMLFFARPIIALIKQSVKKLLARKAQNYALSEDALQKLIASNNLFGVYTFFMNYIAQQIKISTTHLDIDEVEKYCKNRNLPQTKIDDFLTFLNQCSASKYSRVDLTQTEQETLIKKAHYWFLTLKP
jgi:hypothetical protein